MKRLLLAVALACAFASSAWAQPAVNATRTVYKEVYNSTADDASTHTVGGTAYTTDSLAISSPFTAGPYGLRYLQVFAIADTAIAGGTITLDSLQVRFIGTNSNYTGVSNGAQPSILKADALTGKSLASPAFETWYLQDIGGGTPQPMPASMVRFKFVTGGTTAARIKNLRIWFVAWYY